MEESCIPSNIQWITHFLTNPKITNQNTIGSGICSFKAWTTIIWYLCRLVYPREISQATMMAGSSRWQSAVIGGNGAWRSRMRTMNPKSNRTCLYRRSDRGPVLIVWIDHCPLKRQDVLLSMVRQASTVLQFAKQHPFDISRSGCMTRQTALMVSHTAVFLINYAKTCSRRERSLAVFAQTVLNYTIDTSLSLEYK